MDRSLDGIKLILLSSLRTGIASLLETDDDRSASIKAVRRLEGSAANQVWGELKTPAAARQVAAGSEDCSEPAVACCWRYCLPWQAV